MASWNEWVPGTNMTLNEVLNSLNSARVGLDVKDKLYWSFYKIVELAIKEGNANFDVAKAAGAFKDLASRLDASDDKLTSATAQFAQKIGELGAVATFKGSATNAVILAKTGMQVGDEWYDTTNQVSLRWNGSQWTAVGSAIKIGEKSVDNSKIANRAVDERTTTFIEVSKNLFIKKNAIANSFWYASGSFGNFVMEVRPTPNINASAELKVAPGTKLFKNKDGTIYFLDHNRQPLNTSNMSSPAGVYTAPANTLSVVFNVRSEDLDTYQLEIGEAETSYVTGQESALSPNIKVKSDNLEDVGVRLIIKIEDENIEIVDKKGIKFTFNKEVTPYSDGGTYQNKDVWRLVDAQKDNESIVNAGAWEMAIAVNGWPDFVGTYHGYERMTDLKILADSVKIDGNTELEAESIRLIYKANLFEQGTENNKIAEVIRVYDFKDEFKLTQKIKWTAEVAVNRAYMTMLPIRPNKSKSIIVNDEFKEYDLSVFSAIPSEVKKNNPNISQATVYSADIGVDVDVSYRNSDISSYFHLYPHETYYNKLYFAYGIDVTTSIGDEWESVTTIKIS